MSVPIVLRVAHPSRRDQRPLSARLAQLAPETLAAILAETERGVVERWADLCDRMCEIDGHVSAVYETRLALVAGARWELEPTTTGDPIRDEWSVQAAEFCAHVLDDIDGFEQAIMDLLDGIGVSFAVQEVGWFWDAAANAIRIRDLQWLHQRRFRFGPEWELRLVDDGRELVPAGRPLSDWPWRFLVHAPRARPGYPSRTGALRRVAWCYLFKRWGQQFWVRGAERFAWPMLTGKVGRNATDDVRRKMLAALEELINDHAAVVEGDGVIQLLESAMKDGGTWKEFHGTMNAEISKAVLGSTDSTEPSKVGAWKAVESRRGTTVDPRTAIDERNIAGTIRGGLLAPLLEFNRHRFNGSLPPVPRIKWIVTGQRREIPPHVISAGVVTRNEVRQSMGLDPLKGPEGNELVTSAGAAAPPAPSAAPSLRRRQVSDSDT